MDSSPTITKDIQHENLQLWTKQLCKQSQTQRFWTTRTKTSFSKIAEQNLSQNSFNITYHDLRPPFSSDQLAFEERNLIPSQSSSCMMTNASRYCILLEYGCIVFLNHSRSKLQILKLSQKMKPFRELLKSFELHNCRLLKIFRNPGSTVTRRILQRLHWYHAQKRRIHMAKIQVHLSDIMQCDVHVTISLIHSTSDLIIIL